MTNMLRDFISAHAGDDVYRLALQRKLYPQLTDEDMAFALCQIEGRQKVRSKLPTFYANPDILYPIRLSVEQCSSEATAKYKAEIIKSLIANRNSFVDLTGGFGIDSYWISQIFSCCRYVEQNMDLCRIAEQNFQTLGADIEVHNATAADFLQSAYNVDLFFIDPARRNQAGRKVVRLEDCSPNIVGLWHEMQARSAWQMVKLSPMIDVQAVVEVLHPVAVYIVAVEGECKEVLAVAASGQNVQDVEIVAANIGSAGGYDSFRFFLQQEHKAFVRYSAAVGRYVYEPNAAVMKSGAYKFVGEYYDLEKLAPDTHLYTSDQYKADFPGRIFEVMSRLENDDDRANVVVRNYPLSAVELQRKLKLKDGGDGYVIGARVGTKPTILYCRRLK